ncbi:MAG: arginine deiminase family protein, partial [Candidatus Methanomethylicia archaeon]
MNYGAQSEYKRLKSVLMHIPGDEINLVDGSSREAYLFREVPDLEKLREEHMKFMEILKGEGVKIYLVEESVCEEIFEIINMCPNMIFTRDTGTITSNGAIIGRMAYQARCVEPLIVMEALGSLKIPIQTIMKPPEIFEGGDAVWLREDTLMIGYGTRTNEEAIRKIVMENIGKTCEKIIAVPLPRRRVHLDGALMVLSENIIVTRIEDISMYPSTMYTEKCIKAINLAKWLKR